MANLEALRRAGRIRNDSHPTSPGSMQHIGNITYGESDRDVVDANKLADEQRPRDVASHEAERLNILVTMLRWDIEKNVREQHMERATEIMAGALETMGGVSPLRPRNREKIDINSPSPFVRRSERGERISYASM